MRHLLILTSRDIENDIVDTLHRSDWTLHFAGSAREARTLISSYQILVGMGIFWPDDTRSQHDEIRKALSDLTRIWWVGVLAKELIDKEWIIGLVAEHLFDFLSLPLDARRLEVILGHAYGMAQIANRFRQSLDHRAVKRFGMIGSSPAMHDLFESIERAAKFDVPVVLQGETGTGKETAARAIHACSVHGKGPFVALSCAATPAARLQAELQRFDEGIAGGTSGDPLHEDENPGCGTLFLDEISELSHEAQASLLNFLEKGRCAFRSTGTARQPSVRLIAATNQGLDELVRADRFRPDLFYRLQVLSIETPSLRERQEDVRTLAQHFLNELRQQHPAQVKGFSRDALIAIEGYEWPGNLRELRNRIQQAALCSRSALITPADLCLEQQLERGTAPSLQEAREEAEKKIIVSALRRNRHNLSRAAEELRVSRMTLYRLLHKHQMERRG
jgi:DNA-binding NtrC family response regulator